MNNYQHFKICKKEDGIETTKWKNELVSVRKAISAKTRTVCTAQKSLCHFFVDLNGRSNQWLVCIDELNEDKKRENAKMVKCLEMTERGLKDE